MTFFEIDFYLHLYWGMWNAPERLVNSNQGQSKLVHFSNCIPLVTEISGTIQPIIDFFLQLNSWNKRASNGVKEAIIRR